MESRALLAIVLSMAVLALYQYYFVSTPIDPVPQPGDSASAPQSFDPQVDERGVVPGEAAPRDPAARAAAAGQTELALAGELQETLRIHAENYTATVTNVGGRLQGFVLNQYQSSARTPLDLVHAAAAAANDLPLGIETPSNPAVATTANGALYAMEARGGAGGDQERTARPGDPVVVVFRWADGRGTSVSKRIEFPAIGNQLRVQVEVVSPGSTDTYLTLGPGLDAVAAGSYNAFLSEGALALVAEDMERWAPPEPAVDVSGPVRWAGIESHYFLAAFLFDTPPQVRISTRLVSSLEPSDDPQTALASVGARVPPEGLVAGIYLGPKKFDYLQQQGYDIDRAVDFGWMGILARPLLALLVWIHSYVGNFGVAIILLTVLLRVVFLPLNHKAMVSMRRMQRLQPQMAAIRAKYKGSKELEQKQKMNEEVMALYKREGVSPFGGCLPMLAQLPILFSFYRLLSVAVELRQAPFVLWVQDLSDYDPYLVLPLLMGGSMLVQQRMTPSPGADPMQARMFKFMPVIFTVLFLYVPSGLVLYWLVNNLLGITQQLYVNKKMDAELQAEKALPKRSKKGKRGKQ
jgi:YidC/Oxa1 family membrane protein insertase